MASQTEIVNTALTALKQDRVLSIDDDTENAAVMRSIWSLKRDAEMSAHPWAFAMTRAKLPASVTAPPFGFARSFPLPTGYLAMVEVGQNFVMYQPTDDVGFSIEGSAVLTDEGSPLYVRYIQRVENVGAWPALFAEALAMRLAHSACVRITGDRSLKDSIGSDYLMAIRQARRQNAIERPPQVVPPDSWWLARL